MSVDPSLTAWGESLFIDFIRIEIWYRFATEPTSSKAWVSISAIRSRTSARAKARRSSRGCARERRNGKKRPDLKIRRRPERKGKTPVDFLVPLNLLCSPPCSFVLTSSRLPHRHLFSYVRFAWRDTNSFSIKCWALNWNSFFSARTPTWNAFQKRVSKWGPYFNVCRISYSLLHYFVTIWPRS